MEILYPKNCPICGGAFVQHGNVISHYCKDIQKGFINDPKAKTDKKIQEEIQEWNNNVRNIVRLKRGLELISDLAVDYDGCRAASSLMALIDEIKGIADRVYNGGKAEDEDEDEDDDEEKCNVEKEIDPCSICSGSKSKEGDTEHDSCKQCCDIEEDIEVLQKEQDIHEKVEMLLNRKKLRETVSCVIDVLSEMNEIYKRG